LWPKALLPIRLKKSFGDKVEFFKTVLGNWKILENRGEGFVAESAFTYKTEKSFGDEVEFFKTVLGNWKI